MERIYRTGDRIVTVRVERRDGHYRVLVDGREHEVIVRRNAAPAYDLIVDGRDIPVLVARAGGARFVRLGEGDPVMLETGARAAVPRAAAGPAAGDPLAAGMDGRIAAVLVNVGDVVESGATLLILEAMKMEMRMVAPHHGRVRTLSCAVGDVVERGRVLVALEAAT
jgi:3-methylcrotonyl-CoA carboxylase alpha subunit